MPPNDSLPEDLSFEDVLDVVFGRQPTIGAFEIPDVGAFRVAVLDDGCLRLLEGPPGYKLSGGLGGVTLMGPIDILNVKLGFVVPEVA